ncbi:hypothetical protein CTI12_AA140870 [Artemisia annua]|uniref:Uncharacterized protein n=1 Tax=Artemisia annua TaxID=35608 RepID=A0A2U1PKM4_ARTAN|nr:hypothetical protein CTI12_AA140870 [Artemisia annua]
MGNCIKKQPAIHPDNDDCRSLVTSPENKSHIGNHCDNNKKVDNYGEKKVKTEIKIKISKKQLEKLLGTADVKGLTTEQVLAQLMNVSDRVESHQRAWRPALQSIPE